MRTRPPSLDELGRLPLAWDRLPVRRRLLAPAAASAPACTSTSVHPRRTVAQAGTALGGVRIVRAHRPTPDSLAVEFVSNHPDKVHQLYAGRKLLATTLRPADRYLAGPQPASTWPEHVHLLAVDEDAAGQDFGDLLPVRPYNRVRLQWSAAGFPDDALAVDVYAGASPLGEVDTSQRIGRVLYQGDLDYSYSTPALAGSGWWLFQLIPVDDTPGGGNAGTAVEACQDVLAYPPDFDRPRFTTSVAGQILTLTATLP